MTDFFDPTRTTRDTRILFAPTSDDLHLNIVHLRAGERIDPHVNTSLDVAIICTDGSGELDVDGQQIPLVTGSVAIVARGANRSIAAGKSGVRYVTVHRRRGGIMPTVRGE